MVVSVETVDVDVSTSVIVSTTVDKVVVVDSYTTEVKVSATNTSNSVTTTVEVDILVLEVMMTSSEVVVPELEIVVSIVVVNSELDVSVVLVSEVVVVSDVDVSEVAEKVLEGSELVVVVELALVVVDSVLVVKTRLEVVVVPSALVVDRGIVLGGPEVSVSVAVDVEVVTTVEEGCENVLGEVLVPTVVVARLNTVVVVEEASSRVEVVGMFVEVVVGTREEVDVKPGVSRSAEVTQGRTKVLVLVMGLLVSYVSEADELEVEVVRPVASPPSVMPFDVLVMDVVFPPRFPNPSHVV